MKTTLKVVEAQEAAIRSLIISGNPLMKRAEVLARYVSLVRHRTEVQIAREKE